MAVQQLTHEKLDVTSALLRLFRCVEVDNFENTYKHKRRDLQHMVRRGYFVDPCIRVNEALIEKIDTVLGCSAKEINSSLHKSWSVVLDSPIEELVFQQLVHYFSVYFSEWANLLGDNSLDSKGVIYMPHEELDIPELKDDVPLIYIAGIKAKDIRRRVSEFAQSGVALSVDSMNDLSVIIEKYFSKKQSEKLLESCANRELKMMLYGRLDTAPADPEEYLRYVVYKVTDGETLIVKNKKLLSTIKESSKTRTLSKLLEKAPADLAKIFHRYKPIFLALKSMAYKKDKGFFNRLRKRAKTQHEPMPLDYLNNVTALLQNGGISNEAQLSVLREKLEGASIFRKVRLANALAYRLAKHDGNIIYRIRTGRAWLDSSFVWLPEEDITRATYEVVLESIVDSMRPRVEGKTFYIPEGVDYSMPATEKQFFGNLPMGTRIDLPENDLIVGIHWKNQNGCRIDLDLSTIDLSGNKVGWDARYRQGGKGVLFSGDVISAPPPRGASELFYISKTSLFESKALWVNFFNLHDDDGDMRSVPCDVIIAQENPNRFGSNYMVDPNNILVRQTIQIDSRQTVVGLIDGAQEGGGLSFNFFSSGLGDRRTASGETGAINAMVASASSNVSLVRVLEQAGAKVVREKPVEGEFEDLSPEMLAKDTILRLLSE